jgi:hypothetical protein
MKVKHSKKEILFIDPHGMDKIDEGFVLHPYQLKYANIIEKESFDEVFIDNTPSSMLTHKSFFYIYKLLKKHGKVEILVSQHISVLQDLDAEEIESNAKLAGFASIDTLIHEQFDDRIDDFKNGPKDNKEVVDATRQYCQQNTNKSTKNEQYMREKMGLAKFFDESKQLGSKHTSTLKIIMLK